MTAEEIQSKLAIVRENLQRLEELPQASYDEFMEDFRTADSALHRLQTSIQALIDIGTYVVADCGLGAPATSRDVLERLEQHGLLPAGSTAKFGPVFGFGNRVVHLYDRVDPEIVYRILVERRDDLAELADLLLAAVEGGESHG